MKECSYKHHIGKRMRPMSEYRKRAKSPDGYSYICNECTDRISERWRRKNHGRKMQKQQERRESLMNRWRAWKKAQGCKFCDETFAPCLQLHHLETHDKEDVLSEMVTQGHSWENIMAEAAKGIVVCGNCHTKIHYGELVIRV